MPVNASSAHCTCAGRCADLCPWMCVYERVRLIEVVRVKIIPSGDVAGGDSVWGAAMGVGKERVRSGKTEDTKCTAKGGRLIYGIVSAALCLEAVIQEGKKMKWFM